MIELKKLFISILIPNLFGLLGNILGNSSMGFNEIIKPPFSPPGIVFPIVWFILYTLMGISSYIIYMSNSENKEIALKTYFIQLILNCLWTFLFFNLNLYLLSFIWILVMIYFVIEMIYQFSKINKPAAYLQTPYLLWLIFASILTLSIYILN